MQSFSAVYRKNLCYFQHWRLCQENYHICIASSRNHIFSGCQTALLMNLWLIFLFCIVCCAATAFIVTLNRNDPTLWCCCIQLEMVIVWRFIFNLFFPLHFHYYYAIFFQRAFHTVYYYLACLCLFCLLTIHFIDFRLAYNVTFCSIFFTLEFQPLGWPNIMSLCPFIYHQFYTLSLGTFWFNFTAFSFVSYQLLSDVFSTSRFACFFALFLYHRKYTFETRCHKLNWFCMMEYCFLSAPDWQIDLSTEFPWLS